jgi:hypothetical protein
MAVSRDIGKGDRTRRVAEAALGAVPITESLVQQIDDNLGTHGR